MATVKTFCCPSALHGNTTALEINDSGQIVGDDSNGTVQNAFLATPIPCPVPKPASMMLLGSGLLAWAVLRGKLRRLQNAPLV